MPSQSHDTARIIIVMGVSGCGKSSIGTALAAHFGAPFLDGDDFHPPANVEKMRSGNPLTDEDRWPWLDTLGTALHQTASIEGRVFAACSALKRSYRDALRRAAGEAIFFVFLDGTRDLIAGRMAARVDHYMPTGLLDSQIATLEPLQEDEHFARIDIDQPLDAIEQQAAKLISS